MISNLPIEIVLGIQGNLEHDDLRFWVHLKDIPATRMGMLSSIYDPVGFVAPFKEKSNGMTQYHVTEEKIGKIGKISLVS